MSTPLKEKQLESGIKKKKHNKSTRAPSALSKFRKTAIEKKKTLTKEYKRIALEIRGIDRDLHSLRRHKHEKKSK